MSTPQAVLERFPLAFLVFILSVGLFVTLSFPFDFFSLDFSEGLRLPNTETLREYIFVTIPSYIRENFAPFINVKHLGSEFPWGFIKILLASSAVGTIIYFFYGIYGAINHFLRKCIMKPFNALCFWRDKAKKEKGSRQRSIVEKLEFSAWVRKIGLAKYLDFLYSTQMITTGLLYGSETFFTTVLALGLILVPERWLVWVIFALLLCIFSYLVFWVNRNNYGKERSKVWKSFDAHVKNKVCSV